MCAVPHIAGIQARAAQARCPICPQSSSSQKDMPLPFGRKDKYVILVYRIIIALLSDGAPANDGIVYYICAVAKDKKAIETIRKAQRLQ
jgi:hypothetical protein